MARLARGDPGWGPPPSGAASDLPSGEGAMADHKLAAGLAVGVPVPCPRAGEWKILFKGKTHNVN